jgi:GH24 family phage-related lysozyme (muramidase)
MRKFSAKGRETVTEPWEECVLYVYDDKVPKRRINGRLAYPEWDGGPVKGTLSIGFGHTDAAGAPKIVQGMRITREQAGEILSRDLAPCERLVNRALRVEVTQHQFDALVDTAFNCPSAIPALAKLINAGNLQAVPAKLMQYTYSRGADGVSEHMQGLVNRRAAEIKFWNTPDDPDEAEIEHTFAPKAERNPPPMTMASSRTTPAVISIIAGTVGEAASSANEALQPVIAAKGTLQDLGLFDHLSLLAHNPTVLICIVVVGFAAFIWWDRRSKLVNDHV